MTRAAAGVPGREIPFRRRAFTAPGFAVSFRAMAIPLETTINRALAWGIGLLLGVLTVRTEYFGTPTDFVSRVAPADILCLALLAVLFLRHRMKPPPPQALLYVAAIVISMIPGLLVTSGEQSYVWVGASALLMAFCYYVVGLTFGASRVLLRCLLGGLCIGVLGQAIVVAHDLMAPNQWFPDPMDGRVRGTFKAAGQLAAYGFCAAGLLITFGTTLGTPAFRKVCVALAFLAASFVYPASRRMGILSMFVWAALFPILAWRFAGRRFYKVFVGGLVAAMIVLAALWPQVEASFVGQRFMSAVSSMGRDEGFIQNQFHAFLATAGQWFPFGFGVGRGSHINPGDGHEVHNGILAVLVELGVLGLAGFMSTILYPLLKRAWQRRSREHEFLGVMLTSFLLISLFFMFHTTLFRDRAFLLYLGIATTVVAQESRLDLPSNYFPAAAAFGAPADGTVPTRPFGETGRLL